MKNISSKIGFIILHYNDYKMTVECVESILALQYSESVDIVIVDNNSPDKSAELLKSYFQNISNVKIMFLDKNYGYSIANNKGYQYLTNYCKYDFIVVANNDILFKQKDFLELLVMKYEEHNFYICGPDVYAIYKKEHQNPLALHPRTYEEICKWIQYNRKKLRFLRVETLFHNIYLCVNNWKIYEFYKKYFAKRPQKEENDWKNEQSNIVLSGSCLIFSKNFIEKSNKLFDPETFFYHEEDILAQKCRMNDWKTIYTPLLKVEHLEGVATNQKHYYERMKFRYENFINSGTIYQNYLQERNIYSNEK